MIYLISGASRSGKTLIAKTLLKKQSLPYLSLDWLMMGFNNGIPEYGIHHLLWPDDIARRIWPFFKGMLENMLFEGVDYVIEGEAMLPELLTPFMATHPGKFKVVFVGYTTIDVEEKVNQVKAFSGGENDWLTRLADEKIIEHTQNMLTHSKRIKADCERHGITYFDTSTEFPGTIQQAIGYLLK